MAKLVLTFVHERQTKNTERYQEAAADVDGPAVGTLYVQKAALKGSGICRRG